MKIINQKIAVGFEFPVIFTRDALNPKNLSLGWALDRLKEPESRRAMVFVDAGLAQARPGLSDRITKYFIHYRHRLALVAPPQLVPGGEAAKNSFTHALRIVRGLLERRLDRHAAVVVIGGGAVQDLVGFAASLVHRGLRVVRVPTTVLAQCDSGVGVKTAVNFGTAKNLVGTFAPPFAVVNDFDLLGALRDDDWRGGVAEAFKVALIKDAKFFRWLCRQASTLRRRDPQAMARMIQRCAQLHLDHIRRSGDPFEMGRARPLDFGHWSAHRLEVLSKYRIGHGQAVAAGIALDAAYAVRLGWIAAEDFSALVKGLQQAGLAVWYPPLARRTRVGQRAIFQGLEEFREHLGGELTLTMPRGVGCCAELHAVDFKLMEECLLELKELHTHMVTD
ncbi:MAG: 3-dehydroquinate synthase [Verrucomicrobia bacterium]|nr:MAG: 3-dehydroquinate synthase [Verrucomicrobiota bacterium]